MAHMDNFDSEERREHLKEMREEQAKIKARAIRRRCSSNAKFARRSSSPVAARQKERKERVPPTSRRRRRGRLLQLR
jgi:hypothetical protein